MNNNDICIIGGGPGGSFTALFLAKYGIPCTLIDKAVFPRDKVCGDALSGKVVDQFKRLGEDIYQDFVDQDFHLPSWGVTFGSPKADEIHIPFRQNGERPMFPPGYIAKRIDFDNYLIDQCRNKSEINLIEGCWITDYTKTNEGWSIHTKNGEEISAKLIIAADGAHSLFAKKVAGLDVQDKHHAIGLRAYVKGVADFNEDNYIELLFLKSLLPGYFWLFPMKNGMANVGLGLRSDIVKSRKSNLKKIFYELFKNDPQLKGRLKDAEIVGDVKLFPLPLGSKKRRICGDGYMLIGDAAALIDPFTGEGIGNAMVSGEFAAEQAAKCIRENIFTYEFINDYEKRTYTKIGQELKLSYRMQQLANYAGLFNFIVGKAKKNPALQETISCMFDNLDLRANLKKPSFYLNLIFNKT